MKGIFISFEGVEGSGKSTQAVKLYEHLAESGKDVMLIREPGGTKIGEQIRLILLDIENKGMNFYTESCLYAAARAQLVNDVIKPNLAKGKIIICDRFVDSSFAYQAGARGLGFETVYNLNKPAIDGAMPDITIFIDLSPEEGLARRIGSGKVDRLDAEHLNFHKKVYESYLELAEKFSERYLIINGSDSEDRVFNNILTSLSPKL